MTGSPVLEAFVWIGFALVVLIVFAVFLYLDRPR